MRIQARQEILKIWRATVRASYQDDKWVTGGRDQSNSISDAEQLLCFLYPATELTAFRLGKPDETSEEALEALQSLGGAIEIPKLLVRVLIEYMERYTNAGLPTFSGEGYFIPHEPGTVPRASQVELDVVDSFSMSITLSLAVLSFTRIFRGEVRREELIEEVKKLEELASLRLTGAMVGLLRSFSVHVFSLREQAGQILCRRSNQRNLSERQVIRDLQNELRRVKSGLRDLTIGSGQEADLDSSDLLFECGWSWGIVKGAQPIDWLAHDKVRQPEGVAVNNPYLYFTNVALGGLADLFSERTRTLGLLNEEQRRLAQALQIRWDLTQSYWSTIATFDAAHWPLADLPWCTSDGQETDYYSLLVSSMVVQQMVTNRASDAELGRVYNILEELANRGRINRRPLKDDPAIKLHAPGVRLTLRGSEILGDQPVDWLVSNFSPLLLKRTLEIAGLVRDTDLRGRLLTLADNVWDHLLLRRLKDGPGQELWDQPNDAYPQLSIRHEQQSWYFTERLVECLVEAAKVVTRAPVHSPQLTDLATELLHEADHLFDRELLSGSGEAGPSMRAVLNGIRAKLRRAWEIKDERPGSAMGLASEVLRDLERLTSARQDATEGI
jgi:hypothetical protein